MMLLFGGWDFSLDMELNTITVMREIMSLDIYDTIHKIPIYRILRSMFLRGEVPSVFLMMYSPCGFAHLCIATCIILVYTVDMCPSVSLLCLFSRNPVFLPATPCFWLTPHVCVDIHTYSLLQMYVWTTHKRHYPKLGQWFFIYFLFWIVSGFDLIWIISILLDSRSRRRPTPYIILFFIIVYFLEFLELGNPSGYLQKGFSLSIRHLIIEIKVFCLELKRILSSMVLKTQSL